MLSRIINNVNAISFLYPELSKWKIVRNMVCIALIGYRKKGPINVKLLNVIKFVLNEAFLSFKNKSKTNDDVKK